MRSPFAARAGSVYAALVKHSLASVRRAEALEVQRGVASDRNARRDARIETIRLQRMGRGVARAQQSRMASRASLEQLSYRNLYQHALAVERERLMLEAHTSEEARRKTAAARQLRQAALENFQNDQMAMLQERLGIENEERGASAASSPPFPLVATLPPIAIRRRRVTPPAPRTPAPLHLCLVRSRHQLALTAPPACPWASGLCLRPLPLPPPLPLSLTAPPVCACVSGVLVLAAVAAAAFRERVQTAMAAKIDAEARAKAAAALKALQDQLAYNEALGAVPVV